MILGGKNWDKAENVLGKEGQNAPLIFCQIIMLLKAMKESTST